MILEPFNLLTIIDLNFANPNYPLFYHSVLNYLRYLIYYLVQVEITINLHYYNHRS